MDNYLGGVLTQEQAERIRASVAARLEIEETAARLKVPRYWIERELASQILN